MDHITFLTLTVAYCKQTAKKCVNVKVGGSVHKLYMNYCYPKIIWELFIGR